MAREKKKSEKKKEKREKKDKKAVKRGSKELLEFVTVVLDDNKAEDIAVLNVKDKSSIADYMVVASGRSQTQVGALAGILVKKIKDKYGSVLAIEGKGKSDWIVLDLGNIIVHIFHPEARSFYKIEDLWND